MNKYLIILFNIIIGLVVIFYTIYKRIIRTRLPKNLFIIQTDINWGLFIFIFMGLIISAYIIIINLRIILRKQPYEDSYLSDIASKINKVIENALDTIYELAINLFGDPYDKVSLFAQKFYKYFKNITEALFVLILFFIRAIILSCFLIDVFILFQLQYMYKALYLLCFSLLIKIIFHILEDFSTNLKSMESLLIIKNVGINAEGLPRTQYEFKDEYKHLDLDYHVEQYILCNKVSGYLETYNKFKTLFTPYFNVIIYGFYLIGWVFIVYCNLACYITGTSII